MIWKLLLKLTGWKTEITVPYRDKCIICVAPHTSNFDFLIGLISYRAIGRKAGFLMKDFWFFFPLKYILKSLGGIPVKKSSKGNSLTKQIIEDFNKKTQLNLAITPEGTRKAVTTWKTGFLYIANGANVIIQLGIINFKDKKIIIKEEYSPTGDIETDLKNIKNYYSRLKPVAKYPDKFTI